MLWKYIIAILLVSFSLRMYFVCYNFILNVFNNVALCNYKENTIEC